MLEYFVDGYKDNTLFIVSEEKNFAFLNISKNAITTLKSIVLQERGLKNLPHHTIHRMIGHCPNQYNIEPFNIYDYEKKRGKELIKFAVIRDPVSRLISTYKLFWLDNYPHAYFNVMKQKYNINTLDKFIQWVANYELTKPVLEQDEHIRKQLAWLKDIQYLNYIVPIEHLDDFIHNKLHIENFNKENATNHKIELSKEQINMIKTIYADDYIELQKIPQKLIYG